MTKSSLHLLYRSLPLVAAGVWTLDAAAADPSSASGLSKPNWLTDLSVGVKESYDDNVFLSGVDPKYYPANYPVPAGSVAALENRSSWVTTVSPKVGVSFTPLLGEQKVLQTFTLAYAPDYAFYHEQSSETYQAHRFIAGVKGSVEALTFNADDTLTYIHGSEYGPTYPGAYLTAYNTAVDRERREQIQERANVTFQYDWNQWFVRPTASLLDCDLRTHLINVSGYQNYADRYDVNGGADAGYKVLPKRLALTVGYRYGHQYQQQFSFTPYSSPSDYQRVLAGVEGHPWSWLEAKLQMGPDFRDYAGNSATHTTPVNHQHMATYYGEAALTATLTPHDSIAFKYKQWQWVSSIGKVPYFDSTYDLSYHRKVTNKLGLDVGWRLVTADYNSGNLPTCTRNDWQYTISAGAGYAVNSHLNLNLTYAVDLGRNDQGGIPNPSTREYDHQLISLGAVMKF